MVSTVVVSAARRHASAAMVRKSFMFAISAGSSEPQMNLAGDVRGREHLPHQH
jgi:hypothetical protein